jgi:hypothetical protein
MRKTIHTRRGGVAVLVIAVAGAIACSERAVPTAPAALAPVSPSAARGSDRGPVRAAVLRRVTPLRSDEVACRMIDPNGALGETTMALKAAGLRVSFPTNSVSAPTRICLTAHAGSLLTYTFQPHGLQFSVPIRVQQDLRKTTAFHNPALTEGILAGYLLNGVAVDVDADGVARFEETFATALSDDADAPTTTTPVRASFSTLHFSGYALASGKTAADSVKAY